MLEAAAKWLRDQTLEHLSVEVSYCPKDGNSKTIRAVIGTTLFQTETDYGVATTTEARDFIVSTEELPDDPRRGDVIIWHATRYEVLAPGSEPCWRWSDGFHLVRRIHTKEIGREEVNDGNE